eukprot:3844195-Pleurochrysis_carterae.AAC.1
MRKGARITEMSRGCFPRIVHVSCCISSERPLSLSLALRKKEEFEPVPALLFCLLSPKLARFSSCLPVCTLSSCFPSALPSPHRWLPDRNQPDPEAWPITIQSSILPHPVIALNFPVLLTSYGASI